VASFAWAMAEYIAKGKPSVLGFCSGAVGGLVVITPACGFVSPSAAVLIGVFAGLVPYLACTRLKNTLGYDDALDTFGVHAVGGTLGAFLTGLFATPSVNANLGANLGAIVGHTLWLHQLAAMALTIVLAVLVTLALGLLLRFTIDLRPALEVEEVGLDIAEHGEEAYTF